MRRLLYEKSGIVQECEAGGGSGGEVGVDVIYPGK